MEEKKKYEKPVVVFVLLSNDILLNSGEIDFSELEGDPD